MSTEPAAGQVALPQIEGAQFVIDLFPQKDKKHVRKKKLKVGEFHSFLVLRTDRLDQRYFWELFLRVVNLADVAIWPKSVVERILELNWEEISPPRNKFIYNTTFWPFPDLFSDVNADDLRDRLNELDLSSDRPEFLFSLACHISVLIDTLLHDMASVAPAIHSEVSDAGYFSDEWREETSLYAGFLAAYGEA